MNENGEKLSCLCQERTASISSLFLLTELSIFTFLAIYPCDEHDDQYPLPVLLE